MMIETEHVESFRILRDQNFDQASREGLVSAIQAINACNPLFPSDLEPMCRIYPIFEERNQVARFAANHGMLHFSELVDYSFVALRDLLDIDIGRGPHLPTLQIQSNFGRGEVLQGPKPKRHKKVVVEEKEFAALLKIIDKVAHLEKPTRRTY